MKKILCPTDFSDTANNAIVYAAKLAQAMKCDLTLLNIQSLFDLTPAELVIGKQTSVAAAATRLEAQSIEVSRAFKISCYSEIDSGFTKLSTAIAEKARHFDLIVMGTDGADDLYQFFSGSNTYNAILKSRKPCLLVPDGYAYSEVKSMVYAYDYLRNRNLPLPKLAPFVNALHCQLTVLQVMEEAYSKDAENDLKELQFIIKSFHGDALPFEFDTIRSSEVAQSINSYMLRNEADILALCSVHRSLIGRMFHKSIVENISTVCNYPVYVFHD